MHQLKLLTVSSALHSAVNFRNIRGICIFFLKVKFLAIVTGSRAETEPLKVDAAFLEARDDPGEQKAPNIEHNLVAAVLEDEYNSDTGKFACLLCGIAFR